MEQIKLLVTGDFFGGRRLKPLINQKQYENIFGDLIPIIKAQDIAITNLESPITNSKEKLIKTGPNLKADPETIEVLKLAGFDVFSLSNNHIMDYGDVGLTDTIDLIKKNGLEYVGAGYSLTNAREILYSKIKGKKIAFLNFSENEWASATSSNAGANPLDVINNSYDIAKANKEADYVIVQYHGGIELYNLPSPRIKKICRFFAEVGANIVICHHSHYYSGYEEYNDSIIFYGLGNFIFDNSRSYNDLWNWGLSVELTLNNQRISYNIIPHRQGGESLGVKLLDEDETKSFNADLGRINNIILDDNLLEERFNNFVDRVNIQYWNYLKPYSNKLLNFLFRKKLLPTFISKNKKLLLLNLIRCETHRDILIKLLNEKVT